MTATGAGPNAPVPIRPLRERRLRALGERYPDLREAAGTYRVLVRILRDAPANAAPVAVSAGDAGEKLARGVPLLVGATLLFDLDATRRVAIRLAEALSRRGVANSAPVAIALARGRFPLERLLRHAAAGDSAYSRALARVLAVDPAILDVVALNAVKPALRAWRRQLAPVAGGVPWERGYCFVCGARAALAELTGNELSRHLRCGRCGAGWRVRRLLCPFCGNENPSSLGFLQAGDAMETARVEVCDDCGEYLKVVTTFEPGAPDEVALDDLATLPLDKAARALGYLCLSAGCTGRRRRASSARPESAVRRKDSGAAEETGSGMSAGRARSRFPDGTARDASAVTASRPGRPPAAEP